MKNLNRHEQHECRISKKFLQFSSLVASFGVYVPDDSDLLKKIQERADADHDGKVSSYARAAIERDLNGHVDERSPTILVDLAKAFLGPVIAEDMATACEGVNQRRELHQLLTRYIAERSEKPKPARFKTPT